MVVFEAYEFSKDMMTTKFKFTIESRYVVEFVLVERPEKNIICFPSQIGCKLSCIFCRSGKFVRDLTPDEIHACIMRVKWSIQDENKPLLLSCMGEGEPSLNPHILDIFRRIRNQGDKFALATTGINPLIFKKMNLFNDDLKIMLSLHATDEIRRKFLIKKTKDVESLIERFMEFDGKKEINYVLLKDFNDTVLDCFMLRKISRGIPVKINQYNKVNPMLKQSRKRILFMLLYKLLGGKIEYYKTDGTDISAACGMMTHQIK